MRLYLVRHAKSLRNHKVKSKKDAELSEDGIEQAKRLGIWFKNIKIDHIYCSKMKRAISTLKEILHGMNGKFNKIPVTYTSEISEHNIGIYGNNGLDDMQSYYSDARKSGIEFYNFKPKNGESFSELQERAKKFYLKLLKKHKNQNVLIVGHGIYLKHLILSALNLPPKETKFFYLENSSVSQIVTNEKGKVTHFHVNDFHHLLMGGMLEKHPKLLLRK